MVERQEHILEVGGSIPRPLPFYAVVPTGRAFLKIADPRIMQRLLFTVICEER